MCALDSHFISSNLVISFSSHLVTHKGEPMTCGKYWASLLAELRLVNWDKSGADYCSHRNSKGATVAQRLKARDVCCGQHKTVCEVVTPKAPAATPAAAAAAQPGGVCDNYCKNKCALFAKPVDNVIECNGCTAGKVGAGGCFPGAKGYNDATATLKPTSPPPATPPMVAKKLVAKDNMDKLAATIKAKRTEEEGPRPCCASCHEVENSICVGMATLPAGVEGV
jgi:hypothetical protein